MIEHGPLLERLLAGDFVCAVSDDNAYRHLANEETREAIDAYLHPLNRRLASNEDASVYYLAWPGVPFRIARASIIMSMFIFKIDTCFGVIISV